MLGAMTTDRTMKDVDEVIRLAEEAARRIERGDVPTRTIHVAMTTTPTGPPTLRDFPRMRLDLTCPECSSPMSLKRSRHGVFYGCTSWRRTQCSGSHGAHPDGSPLGIPADAATKAMRREAHRVFDQLWTGPSPMMKRVDAYAWMSRVMGVRAAHIAEMSAEKCKILIAAVNELKRKGRVQ